MAKRASPRPSSVPLGLDTALGSQRCYSPPFLSSLWLIKSLLMYVPNTSRGESPFPTSHSEAASFRGCVVSLSHGDTPQGPAVTAIKVCL